MKFKTIQEVFNYYRTKSLEEIEKRAAEIKGTIEKDAEADIVSLNIEISGLDEAKKNLQDKQTNTQSGADQRSNTPFNPVANMNFDNNVSISGDADIFASKEYRSAFYKKMLNKPLSDEDNSVLQKANIILMTEKRASFINTSEAAAVIPTQTLNEIYKKAADMGGVLSLVRRFDIPANLSVPVATPEDAAEWHVEGAEVTPTNQKPTNIVFNAYELMKVFSISAAVRSMNISAYENYLQEELARVMIVALQKAAISGTGTGQPTGLLKSGIITNTHSGKAGYETFLQTAAKLKRGYSMGSAWAMNNTTLYNKVMSIVDATGKPIFNEAKDGEADRILGKPIVIDDFIPDDNVIFGNFKYYGMNYPQDILLEVSRDSSFRKGLIDYRAIGVADGKPIINEAFVKLTLTGETP